MCLIAKVFLFSVCNFVHRASSEWTPPWMQLKFARSSLTFSVAMSTRTFTLHPPSPWMTPRCFLPMPAWTRYTQCLSRHCFLHHGSSLCSHWFTTFRISSEIRSSKLSWKKNKLFFSQDFSFFCTSFSLVQAHLPQHYWSITSHGQAASCCQHPEVYSCRRQTQWSGRCG